MDHRQTGREDGFEGTPEEAILKAMGAYDNFGRHTVMSQRAELTKTQMDVIIGLDLFGTMSMTQMSEHLAVSKEQASRSVAPLVECGLVGRKRSPREHRVVEISLTEDGQAFNNASKREAAEDVRRRLSLLSQEDRDLLIEASRTAERLLCKLRDTEIEQEAAARADGTPSVRASALESRESAHGGQGREA